MTITELSIKRPTMVVVIFSVLAVLGVFGFVQLKYELMPKMNIPVMTITTVYPGGSPYEVETSVSKVIEDAVTGIDKVKDIRSFSFEGRSFVILEFEQSANIDNAAQDAQRKINEVQLRLPKDSRPPIVSKLAFDELPVLKLSVNGDLKPKEFYQFIIDRVQSRLSKTSGVGMVQLIGGEQREIKVMIDNDKVKSFGLSIGFIAAMVKNSNIDFPTGKIYENNSQYVVRVTGKVESLDNLKELVISKSRSGGEIKLKDIAEVVDATKELATINRLNGFPSIGMSVQKTSTANTVETVEKVKEELKQLEIDYKDVNLKFDIAQDGSLYTIASANAVKEDLAIAVLLVALIMLVFLHSFRNSLIVLVAIPASLVSAFFLMYMFNISLNMMTLLAMSLVIGILVDDSIVVLENIHRHLEMGDEPRVAALRGRNEIGFAALSITLVDVVVFVPLALITGVIGNFLREYSLVVVFSTLMSLFVSFTITPMLASRFSRKEELNEKSIFGKFGLFFENFFNRLTNLYTRVLKWSLNNRKKVLFGTLLLFISSFVIVGLGFVSFEFMPVADRGELLISLEIEPGAKIQSTNQVIKAVENIVSAYPEVVKVSTSVGISTEGMIGQEMNNAGELMVIFNNKNERKLSTDELAQNMKKKIMEIPGIKVRVAPISFMGSANRSPIEVIVTGADYKDIMKGARIIEQQLKSIKGTTDVRVSVEDGKPELKVDIDRNKLASFGLSIGEIGATLRIALTGDDDSKFREGNNEYSIRIMIDDFDRTNVENLGNLSFINQKGQQVQLKQFANIYQQSGPSKLERKNRISSVNVLSQVLGTTSGNVSNALRTQMATVQLPAGVKWEFGGEVKMMIESFIAMIIAFFAGVLFVYMIMVALYDSYLYPFVVLFSIPVALVGSFYLLALTAKSISIFSILGIIMLNGLVAKNAILLVDRTNNNRQERGMSVIDALIEAGRTRLRPIMMTTLTMIIGMMPIAFSTAAGAESKSGLGMVLIGGLTSSLLLSLLLIPVVYEILEGLKEKFNRKFKKNK